MSKDVISAPAVQLICRSKNPQSSTPSISVTAPSPSRYPGSFLSVPLEPVQCFVLSTQVLAEASWVLISPHLCTKSPIMIASRAFSSPARQCLRRAYQQPLWAPAFSQVLYTMAFRACTTVTDLWTLVSGSIERLCRPSRQIQGPERLRWKLHRFVNRRRRYWP